MYFISDDIDDGEDDFETSYAHVNGIQYVGEH